MTKEMDAPEGEKHITRREFSKYSLFTLSAFFSGIALTSCAGGGGYTGENPDETDNEKFLFVDNNQSNLSMILDFGDNSGFTVFDDRNQDAPPFRMLSYSDDEYTLGFYNAVGYQIVIVAETSFVAVKDDGSLEVYDLDAQLVTTIDGYGYNTNRSNRVTLSDTIDENGQALDNTNRSIFDFLNTAKQSNNRERAREIPVQSDCNLLDGSGCYKEEVVEIVDPLFGPIYTLSPIGGVFSTLNTIHDKYRKVSTFYERTLEEVRGKLRKGHDKIAQISDDLSNSRIPSDDFFQISNMNYPMSFTGTRDLYNGVVHTGSGVLNDYRNYRSGIPSDYFEHDGAVMSYEWYKANVPHSPGWNNYGDWIDYSDWNDNWSNVYSDWSNNWSNYSDWNNWSNYSDWNNSWTNRCGPGPAVAQ